MGSNAARELSNKWCHTCFHSARDSAAFFVTKGTLAVPGLYKLKLAMTLPTIPPTQTEVTTSFTLLASDLIAVIKNGDTKVGRSQQLYLDARDSQEPDFTGRGLDSGLTYEWSCKLKEMMCRDRNSKEPLSFPRTAQLVMSSSGFELDTQYVFTLDIRKDSRTASASVTMVFVDDSYEWLLLDQSSSYRLSTTTNEIHLPSSNFVEGRQYTITVTSFQPPAAGQMCNQVCKGSASFQLRVNRAPSGGQCAVEPTRGFDFSDPDLPLSFQFSYRVNNGTEAFLAPSVSPIRSLYLPSGGVDVTIIAMDSLGAQSVYLLERVTVLEIASVAPQAAQQALNLFVNLGKTSEFSNCAISLAQKLTRDSTSISARRHDALSLRANPIQLSNNVYIQSNASQTLLKIIAKQVPSAGNVLEAITTLFFLVNSTEPLTIEGVLAAVEILRNTSQLVPQVLKFSLHKTNVQDIIYIASMLKDQLQQSWLTLPGKSRYITMLIESISIAVYHGTFDFIDIQKNLVCDRDCFIAQEQILTYKCKSSFMEVLQPENIPVETRFMQINISTGSSDIVSASVEQSISGRSPFPRTTTLSSRIPKGFF
eukprot:766865-Hanusia_phi.AAC.5